jgi:hypothetical protein
MNVEIGTEAAQFPEKEYINGFSLQWHIQTGINNNNYSQKTWVSSGHHHKKYMG